MLLIIERVRRIDFCINYIYSSIAKTIQTWLRYTQGGDIVAGEPPDNGVPFILNFRRDRENSSQQLTALVETTQTLTNEDQLFMSFSYYYLNATRNDGAYSGNVYAPNTFATNETEELKKRRFIAYREDEYSAKMIFRKANDSTKQAYGIEASYDIFGLPVHGSPHVKATAKGIFSDGSRNKTTEILAGGDWPVFSYAAFAEVQWMIDDAWTLFSAVRFDKHQYTDWFYSPRFSLIYTPEENQVWKALYNQSVKRAANFDLRQAHIHGYQPIEESLESFELSYSNSQKPHFTYQAALFTQKVKFFLYSNVIV